MVWMMGHYPDCNSGPPCLVVDDYKKKHNFRPSPEVGGFAAYVLFKNYDNLQKNKKLKKTMTNVRCIHGFSRFKRLNESQL